MQTENHTWRNVALIAAFGAGAWAAYTLWRNPEIARKVRDRAVEGYDKAKDLAQSGAERVKETAKRTARAAKDQIDRMRGGANETPSEGPLEDITSQHL